MNRASRRRVGRPFFLLLWALAGGAAAAADAPAGAQDLSPPGPARVDALVAGGALERALQVLDAGQPPAGDPDWPEWERRRLAVLVALDRWPDLKARMAGLPPDLDPGARAALLAQVARAALAHGQAAAARVYLRTLLWSGAGGAKQRVAWRRDVIRAYLGEDRVADAAVAMRRFQEEFRPRDRAWRRLHARVLLRAGRPAEALRALKGDRTHEGRFLALLARLRSDPGKASGLLAQVRALLRATRKRPALHGAVAGLLAELAGHSGDRVARVTGLEGAVTAGDRLFRFGFDDLWDAYLALGEAMGNDAGLLIGDDAAWFKLAARHKKKSPPRYRALLAVVTQKGDDPQQRGKAHYRLLTSLYGAGLDRVAAGLYTRSRRYPAIEDLPPVARYFLSDKAFHAFDVKLAARLVRGLETPPPGQSETEWRLRRARLAVFAGDYRRGLDLAREVLEGHPAPDPELTDALLQVAFDLQGAREHGLAYELFQALAPRVKSHRSRREILFWMAESRAATGGHAEAAELYLRSAVYRNPGGADLWGQTARFNAARELAEAGLTGDAERVYRRLLSITREPRRRALIERQIKHLWLLGPPTTP